MATVGRLRWWIVGLVCVGTIINNIDRNALGVLAPHLTDELDRRARPPQPRNGIARHRINRRRTQVCEIANDSH
ncbi:hypothetical protein [Phenylobacterium sp.]|uniref:hypothetical protein n=1 Tax=Phenylobacterium sp. TaxID=1871053 RepID=UPI003D2746B3